jgi:uncharacterized protein YeeX (DUF496 family)
LKLVQSKVHEANKKVTDSQKEIEVLKIENEGLKSGLSEEQIKSNSENVKKFESQISGGRIKELEAEIEQMKSKMDKQSKQL